MLHSCVERLNVGIDLQLGSFGGRDSYVGLLVGAWTSEINEWWCFVVGGRTTALVLTGR